MIVGDKNEEHSTSDRSPVNRVRNKRKRAGPSNRKCTKMPQHIESSENNANEHHHSTIRDHGENSKTNSEVCLKKIEITSEHIFIPK